MNDYSDASVFWWDYFGWFTNGLDRDGVAGYRRRHYLPLVTIDDLVAQYNYVGFNDLCIYPVYKDMAFYKDPSNKDTKGIWAVYYGHTNQNQTGKEKQNIILENFEVEFYKVSPMRVGELCQLEDRVVERQDFFRKFAWKKYTNCTLFKLIYEKHFVIKKRKTYLKF